MKRCFVCNKLWPEEKWAKHRCRPVPTRMFVRGDVEGINQSTDEPFFSRKQRRDQNKRLVERMNAENQQNGLPSDLRLKRHPDE